MKNNILFLFLLFTFCTNVQAQEVKTETDELTHYMPMYLDMPAELNVHRGYKEINLGFGMAGFRDFNGQRLMLEYDFAPMDKLGFEIEVPFIFVQNKTHNTSTEVPDVMVPEEGGNVQSAIAMRLGINYTLQSFKNIKTSISIGYFNEFESSPFVHFGKPVIEANIYNPFFSVAKIWGDRFHAMLYCGPAFRQSFTGEEAKTVYRFNPTVSYHIGKLNKENFIALECNNVWAKGDAGQMILRPQFQMQLSGKWKFGFVGAVPVATNNHLKGSGIVRIIYSPK